ncbi:MAG: CidA/LrgA family protein [Butyricicoccus sp.]
MDLLLQFTILLGVSFAGELLAALLPLPIPAGIYGLLLLLLGLVTKLIPLDRVKRAGDFLIAIMPVLFIGPAVALIEQFDALRALAVPLLLAIVVSTAVVMAVTGRLAQAIIRRKDGQK